MSTDLDIDAIRERANAATPGPWACDEADSVFDEYGTSLNDQRDISSCIQDAEGNILAECVDIGANRMFMAWSRSDVPALCDEVERLRGQIDKIVGHLVWWQGDTEDAEADPEDNCWFGVNVAEVERFPEATTRVFWTKEKAVAYVRRKLGLEPTTDAA